MAANLGNFPRNPSLKRSWLDCNAENVINERLDDTKTYNQHDFGVKRSRDSSTDLHGDRGYVSNLSESQSDHQDPTEDAESSRGTESPDQDEGLWFCTKGDHTPDPECSPKESEAKEDIATSSTQDLPKSSQECEDDRGEEGDSEDDNVSEISGMSDLDGEGWRPMAGPMSWVQRQMISGANPRDLLRKLLQDDRVIPDDFDNISLWKVIVQMLSEPPKRKKLPHINTMDDVVRLMKQSKKIIVLTGAGVSVSCGIPDFRSRDGVYARLAVEYPDLPDPQAMFDIQYFRGNPRPFFKFAKEMYPGQFEPSASHKFIQQIEAHDQLLRNYTQNIDTLEQVSGIQRVLQCHGSFATATCMRCGHKVSAEAIREEIMKQIIPRCGQCPIEDPNSILKPDIVFFGESLPEEFHRQMDLDRTDCDLLIVMGSSLKVRPVALIPNDLPPNVPQILINREPLKHLNFDVELLGDCDIIVNELCHRLGEGWMSVCKTSSPAREVSREEVTTPPNSSPQHNKATYSHHREADSSGDSQPSQSDSAENSATPSPHTLPLADSSSNLSMMINLERTHISSSPAPQSPTGAPPTPNNTSSSLNSFNKAPVSSTCKCDSIEDNIADSMSGEKQRSDSGMSDVTNALHTEEQLQQLRSAWEPKVINLGARLKDNTYLFVSPNRYVFCGAEVYNDSDPDDDSSSSSSMGLGEDSPTNSDSPLSTVPPLIPHHEGIQLDSSGQRHFGVFSGEPLPENHMEGPSLASPPYSLTFQSPQDESGERLAGSTPSSDAFGFSTQLPGAGCLGMKSPDYGVNSAVFLVADSHHLPPSPNKQDLSPNGT